jgi:hypothetical protein
MVKKGCYIFVYIWLKRGVIFLYPLSPNPFYDQQTRESLGGTGMHLLSTMYNAKSVRIPLLNILANNKNPNQKISD